MCEAALPAAQIVSSVLRTICSVFNLRRAEWAAVAVVVVVVAFVNKVIIDDKGNTWAGLVLVAFWLGVGLVHFARLVARRTAES